MKLIVGLGNPGKEYENTRHNIGFMVIDNYLTSKNITWQTKFKGEYTSLIINSEKIYFLKPTTYMNLSGESVSELVNYFHILPEDILVIHDDLDLPLCKIRIKKSSGAGGHNGIKSIISHLGTNNFTHLKIGISNDKNYETKDYVLGHFNKEEESKIEEIYPVCENIINDFLKYDSKELMNKYNGDLK